MRIDRLSDAALICFSRALLQNELGGDKGLIYQFSDADGVRTGKSGWSFGYTQIDVNNNPNATQALLDIGFCTDEIRALKAQDPGLNMDGMNKRLVDNAAKVDKWDFEQLHECECVPLTLAEELGVDFNNMEAAVHLADYHNQFGMSRGGKMYRWLESRITVPLSGEAIRDFKYTLPWGQARPDDVFRRWLNIVKVCGGVR